MVYSYFLRRLGLAVLTLLAVSWVVFGLAKCSSASTGHLEVDLDLDSGASLEYLQQRNRSNQSMVSRAGLDKPLFYFSVCPSVYPDTLHKVWEPQRRQRMTQWAAATGDWVTVQRREEALHGWFAALLTQRDSFAGYMLWVRLTDRLMQESHPSAFPPARAEAESLMLSHPLPAPMRARWDSLLLSTELALQQRSAHRMWVPTFYWHGFDNQYHHWFGGFFTGRLGEDKAGNPVAAALMEPLRLTLSVNGIALLLAYLVAVPLGVQMARYRGAAFDRWSQRGLLLLYALPTFSLGLLLVWLFGVHPPAPGLRSPEQAFLPWFLAALPRSFVFPILTLTLHMLTVVAFQMRGGMLDTLHQHYLRTARAKGLDENRVYWRHAFRNALFPVITVFGAAFPSIFSGSVVMELLFNYPGLGRLLVEAFQGNNYPLLFALLMFSAMFTIAGMLLADALYAWADPRVRYAARER
ncbi:MAG TPA: ABC transporter permease [Saprospiraceae bacterium]|nr:ABC transporter permease [Saprospiraceae bacterium]